MATEGEHLLAEYVRRRNLGGGRLELAGGRTVAFRPVRLWRPRWQVRDGDRRAAEVVSLPKRETRLSWMWKGDDRDALVALFGCYAILIDDLVTRRMPGPRLDLPG